MELKPTEKQIILEPRMGQVQAMNLLQNSNGNDNSMEIVRKIDRTASSDFNWAQFWSDAYRNKITESMNNEVIVELLSLSYKSCQKNSVESFIKFGTSISRLDLFLNALSKNNCEQISLNGSEMITIIKRLSVENAARFSKVFKDSNFTIRNGEEFWKSLRRESNEFKKAYQETVLNLGSKNTKEENEQIEFFVFAASSERPSTLFPFIREQWEMKNLYRVNYGIFNNVDISNWELVSDYLRLIDWCNSDLGCSNQINLNDWMDVIKYKLLNVEVSSEYKKELVEKTIDLTIADCRENKLTKMISLILDERVKAYDQISKIKCNVNITKNELEVVFNEYYKTIHESKDQEPVRALLSLYFESNLFRGNLTWFQEHMNTNYEKWKEIFDIASEKAESELIKFYKYTLATDVSTSPVNEYVGRIFVNKYLNKGKQILNLIEQGKVEAGDILYNIQKITLAKILKESLSHTERKNAWENISKIIIHDLEKKTTLQSGWDVILSANTILEDYSSRIGNDLSKEINLVNILGLKDTVLTLYEKRFFQNVQYVSFLEDLPLSVEAQWLAARYRKSKLNINEKPDLKINYEEAADRFKSSNILKEIENKRFLMMLVQEENSFRKEMAQFCRLVGKTTKMFVEGSTGSRTLKGKISGPGCYDFEYENKPEVFKVNIEKNIQSISGYTLINSKGAGIRLGNQKTAKGIFVLNQEYRHPRAKKAEKQMHHDAWILPMYLSFRIEEDMSVSRGNVRINFQTNDEVLFRYHYVVPASQGPKFIEPKLGLKAGDLELKRDSDGFLPTLISFGGAGQQRGEASEGGKGLDSRASQVEEYENFEIKEINLMLKQTCEEIYGQDAYECRERRTNCDNWYEHQVTCFGNNKKHLMNEINYLFYKDFLEAYQSNFGSGESFFGSVDAYMLGKKVGLENSERNEMLKFCVSYLKPKYKEQGRDFDPFREIQDNQGIIKSNCEIEIEKLVAADLDQIASRFGRDSANMNQLVPELVHEFSVGNGLAGEVYEFEYAERGQNGSYVEAL